MNDHQNTWAQDLADTVFQPAEKAEGERDAAYRERAHLVALLAAVYPSVWGTDPEQTDWHVVYVQLPTGQVSWHISPNDVDLFPHVSGPVGADHWDGHTTEEKYRRIREHTAQADMMPSGLITTEVHLAKEDIERLRANYQSMRSPAQWLPQTPDPWVAAGYCPAIAEDDGTRHCCNSDFGHKEKHSCGDCGISWDVA